MQDFGLFHCHFSLEIQVEQNIFHWAIESGKMTISNLMLLIKNVGVSTCSSHVVCKRVSDFLVKFQKNLR